MRVIREPKLPFQWWENEPEVRLTVVETTTLVKAYRILDAARDKAQHGDSDLDTDFDTAWLGLSELLLDTSGNILTGSLTAS